jgi:ATP-binding cassette subfamily B protein
LSADQVVVLQNGSVIEAGSHEHLYRRDGVYRQLFDTQFRDAGAFAGAKDQALPA